MAEEFDLYVTSTGVSVPDATAVLAKVQAFYQDTFGTALSLESATPQGRLMELDALSRRFALGVCALCANQMDVDRSQGVFLDSLASLFMLTRNPQSYTTVSATLSGVSGTIVPAGSLAMTTNSDIFELTSSVTLGAYATGSINFSGVPSVNDTVTVGDMVYRFVSTLSQANDVLIGADAAACAANLQAIIVLGAGAGTIYYDGTPINAKAYATVSGAIVSLTATTEGSAGNATALSKSSTAISIVAFSGGENGSATGTFQAQDPGAIACAVGSLNSIVSNIYGWETVTNATAGNLGSDTETDESLRRRIKSSRYSGISLVGNLNSAIAAIAEVQSVYVYNNGTSDAVTYGGVTIPAHSVFISVYGGSDESIAEAIYAKLSGGCGMASVTPTVVYITDPNTNVEYPITFNRPENVITSIAVTATISSGISETEAADTIRKIVVQWANGEISGYDGVAVGGSVSPFFIASAIQDSFPECKVQQVTASRDGLTPVSSPISFGINEMPIIYNSSISVVIDS